MTERNWITKLPKRSNKVENVFYVTERDNGVENYYVKLRCISEQINFPIVKVLSDFMKKMMDGNKSL